MNHSHLLGADGLTRVRGSHRLGLFSAGGGAELVVPNFSPIETDTGK